MMMYATDEQKERYLPPLATGEEIWCQLFSEPAAGSDVAGIKTKAELDRSIDMSLSRARFIE